MSSFGETLRRERELRGIALREVADATKISVRFLQALENDRVEILPGGIFQRAFVRQYASYLGLDPERMVAEFMYAFGGETAGAPKATPSRQPASEGLGLPGGRGLMVAAAVVASLIAVAAWRQLRSDDEPAPVKAQVTAPMPTVLPSDRVYPPPSATPAPVLSQTEGLVLDLTALEDCWVAVQTDGVRVVDRVLARGETQTLSAQREIVLSVGNAGGISFRLNGRNGVSLGRAGEVRRNIVITHQSLPSLVEGTSTAVPRNG